MEAQMKKHWLWILTIVLFTATSLRFNVSIIAWVMYVPLLLLIRDTNGWKGWGAIFLLLQIAMFFQISKIITDPLPLTMTFLYSIPMAVSMWIFAWIYEKVRRRISDLLGIFFFASLMSVSEWLSYSFTELGSWGAMAYTQLDNLAFLQMTSLFGITFASFFIYLSSAFITLLLVSKQRQQLIRPVLITLTVFCLFYSYGVIRLDAPNEGKSIQVAGIASDMIITPQGIPDPDLLHKETLSLISKTHMAIKQGAQLIAWNEGATIIFNEQEADFINQLKSISLQANVELVIAYIVPIDGVRKFENKYLFVSNGEVVDEYFKFHPVPGEGSIKGDRIAKTINLKYGNVSGAICYDFDFPPLARALSKQGMDLAVVPSSDWRGIDPYHSQMATVRGIEGGYAVLRPVRAATSIASDAYGRTRATMNYFEDNNKIMMATLPIKQVETIYNKVGDVFVILLALFLSFVTYRYIQVERR